MQAIDRDTQERIAREQYHDAIFLGRSADGTAHWFSRYHQAVVAFEPDGRTTLKFRDGQMLSQYVAFVRDRRDGWDELRVSDGPAADLINALEGGA